MKTMDYQLYIPRQEEVRWNIVCEHDNLNEVGWLFSWWHSDKNELCGLSVLFMHIKKNKVDGLSVVNTKIALLNLIITDATAASLTQLIDRVVVALVFLMPALLIPTRLLKFATMFQVFLFSPSICYHLLRQQLFCVLCFRSASTGK